ncbi:hypothetical protein [uncultured Chryseobacterium sp.]|jgi:hypothetical protein|uniref:hypothetical protein n=1 Tax=uncultured Chryseobacterium sp. TaxID=259322 RepID=UPI0026085F2F|nr:hypothetical protein [uncultured Chryseobacterium sp.]
MFNKIIILSLGLLLLINCQAQMETKTAEAANTQEASTKENGIIYLREGENKFLKEYEMNVTFKGVSEDSRCPKGVNCIWAGAAVAQVEVMGIATRPVIMNLATTEYPGRNYHQSANFNGYTISLAELTPYPTAQDGSKILSGNYKIGITIKKTEETSGSTTR